MTKCEREGCKVQCERMPPCAKDYARLLRWMKRWQANGPGENIMGEEVAFDVPPGELRAAIAGKDPPGRRR